MPAPLSFVYASIGIGTNSLARMPPPRMPSLWWRKSVVEISGPGPTESCTSSSKTPTAPA